MVTPAPPRRITHVAPVNLTADTGCQLSVRRVDGAESREESSRRLRSPAAHMMLLLRAAMALRSLLLAAQAALTGESHDRFFLLG